MKFFARSLSLIVGSLLYLLGGGIARNPVEPIEIVLFGTSLQISAALLIFFVWFHWHRTAINAPSWRRHRALLASLFIVYGVVIIASMYMLMSLATFSEDGLADAFKQVLNRRFDYATTIIVLAFAASSLIAGVGLLADKEWARVLAKCLALPYALAWPLGFGLGVYAWWALNPNPSTPQPQGRVRPPAKVCF